MEGGAQSHCNLTAIFGLMSLPFPEEKQRRIGGGVEEKQGDREERREGNVTYKRRIN